MLEMLLITPINCAVIAIAVIVHHECLIVLSKLLNHHRKGARIKVLFGVFGAIVAHSIEIWIFGIAYFLLLRGGWGELNIDPIEFQDCVYLSFTCFTTVGFGDIVAIGSLRFLTVLESLTGLVLITWSASFLYLQMEHSWNAE